MAPALRFFNGGVLRNMPIGISSGSTRDIAVLRAAVRLQRSRALVYRGPAGSHAAAGETVVVARREPEHQPPAAAAGATRSSSAPHRCRSRVASSSGGAAAHRSVRTRYIILYIPAL